MNNTVTKGESHLMLDLETLGQGEKAVVLSLGAVEFDSYTGQAIREFKYDFDIKEQLKNGRTLDPDTLDWWAKQGKPLQWWLDNHDGLDVTYGGLCFEDWVKDCEEYDNNDFTVWSRGIDFDLPKLGSLCNITVLWPYWNQSDVRTLDNMFPSFRKNAKKPENLHDPLVDCKYQISYLVPILNHIKANQPTL